MIHIKPPIRAIEDIDAHNWNVGHHDILCQIMHYIPNAGGVAADFVLAVNYHDRMKAIINQLVDAANKSDDESELDYQWLIDITIKARDLLAEMEATE